MFLIIPSIRSCMSCRKGLFHALSFFSSVPAICGRVKGTLERGIVERVWRQFFSDPSQWWDHRLEKRNARYPDFKHKKTDEALWINCKYNPAWVAAELAVLPLGTVQRSNFSWNSMLARYLNNGQYEKTLSTLQQMQEEGLNPDKFTFVHVLNACASLRALEKGRHVHRQTVQSGCELDVFVGGSLIGMYAKCGSIEDAWGLFCRMPVRDVCVWNAMILGYVRCGQGLKALELSGQMQREGMQRDPHTFVAILNACANVGALKEGRDIHSEVTRSGCQSHVFVGSSLVNMYAKCGSIEDAWEVFSKMPRRDATAWNAMILGYVRCGQGQRALELSQQMQGEMKQTDPVTFIAVLHACASVGALAEGRHVHAQIISSCGFDVFVFSSLLDMYAKCGSIEDAQSVFNKMPIRDGVSWTAMLGAYAIHGCTDEALELFEQMSREGIEIDKITFIHLLSACSHAGLVDEGLHYFETMTSVYTFSATADHYACIVDLLGRVGRLHEAEDMIQTSTDESDVVIWKALLGACRVHANVEIGQRIANLVLELDSGNFSGYVLLSNMYAAAGDWHTSASIRGSGEQLTDHVIDRT